MCFNQHISLKTGIISFTLATSILFSYSSAKESDSSELSFFDLNKSEIFKPIAAFELWTTYSMSEQSCGKNFTKRGDFSFRRLRFGGSGSPYYWLNYSFQLHLDRLGEDANSSTKGSYGDKPDIWNAFLTLKLLKKSDLLNIDAGYFWAAISREFSTSPWAVGSFDKSWANWYLRNFVTGKGNGIESGLGFGGIKNFGSFGISYRIGTYEPQAYTSSTYSDRLYTERIMFSFGNPEQAKYSYLLSGNQWRKRNGVTIGLGLSTQENGKLSDSLYFERSMAYGGDILINIIGLHIDGEYFQMKRTAEKSKEFDGTEWHIRAGYTFATLKTFIEPCISYDKYKGNGVKGLFKYIGDDQTLDIGVNWYLNKDKLKLSLHYLNQDGSISPNIGDFIGLGFQFRL